MAAPANPARLFVGNLPWETEDAALQQLFSQCGTVVKCEIPKGRQGRSRGYGIVEFSAPHEAQLAVQQLHGARRRIAGKAPAAAALSVCQAGRPG
jgi:RNA recognition motif-containing protein